MIPNILSFLPITPKKSILRYLARKFKFSTFCLFLPEFLCQLSVKWICQQIMHLLVISQMLLKTVILKAFWKVPRIHCPDMVSDFSTRQTFWRAGTVVSFGTHTATLYSQGRKAPQPPARQEKRGGGVAEGQTNKNLKGQGDNQRPGVSRNLITLIMYQLWRIPS